MVMAMYISIESKHYSVKRSDVIVNRFDRRQNMTTGLLAVGLLFQCIQLFKL